MPMARNGRKPGLEPRLLWASRERKARSALSLMQRALASALLLMVMMDNAPPPVIATGQALGETGDGSSKHNSAGAEWPAGGLFFFLPFFFFFFCLVCCCFEAPHAIGQKKKGEPKTPSDRRTFSVAAGGRGEGGREPCETQPCTCRQGERASTGACVCEEEEEEARARRQTLVGGVRVP